MNKVVKPKNKQHSDFRLKKNKVSNTTKNLIEKSDNQKSKNYKFTRILLILLIIVTCITFVISGILLLMRPNVVALKEVNATLNITNHIGFNLNSDKLHFGSMFPGGKSVRSIDLIPSVDGYVYITVVNESNNWIYVYNQNFFVKNNSITSLNFAAMPPQYLEVGNYEATIRIYILKNKPSFLTKLFLEGKPASLTSESFVPGSAVISLNITNSTNRT